MKTTFNLLIICFYISISSLNVSAQWIQLNNPVGDEVQAITSSDNRLIAATRSGLYKSSNFGEEWQYIHNFPLFNYIISLTIKDNIILVGTTSWGIFRSSNNGETWDTTNIKRADILEFTYRNDTIFATASGWGVYCSIDNGKNWYAKNEGIVGNLSGQIAVNGIKYFGDTLLLATLYGVHRSTNFGSRWELSNDGIGKNSCYCLEGIDNYIFVGTSNGVYRSTNGGLSWHAVNNGIPLNNRALYLAVVGKTIFASTDYGLFRSTDYGASWSTVNPNLPHMLIRPVITSSLNFLYAGNFNGIYASSDNGFSWSRRNQGIQNKRVFDIESVNSTLFARLYYDFHYSTNSGEDWTPTDFNKQINTFIVENEKIFAAVNDGVYLSSNRGLEWIHISVNDSLIKSVYLLKKDNKFLYASTVNGIFRSSDGGKNWVYLGFGDTYGYKEILVADSILLVGISTDHLRGINGDVYRSTDYGSTWTSARIGLPNYLYGIKFLFYKNKFFIYTYNNVYVSTDNSNSWTLFNSQIPSNLYIRKFIVTNDLLFAATSNGVYHFIDSINFWQAVRVGFQNDEVLSISSIGVFLYASVNFKGLFRSNINDLLSSVKYNPMPKNFILYQNYPNPFNSTSRIKYQIANMGHATLKVYDVLGRELATLVDEEKSPGDYEVQFTIRQLTDDSRLTSSGVYFYQLRAGDFIETKKMIYMK